MEVNSNNKINYPESVLDMISSCSQKNITGELFWHIVKRIKDADEKDFLFININLIREFPRNLEKLYEKLYFTITMGKFDRKTIFGIFRIIIYNYEIDLLEYFNFKYILYSIYIYDIDCNNTSLDSQQKLYLYFLILLSDCIDYVKFKLNNRSILGIDVEKNELKYRITPTKAIFLSRVTIRANSDINFMLQCCNLKKSSTTDSNSDAFFYIESLKKDFSNFLMFYDHYKLQSILIDCINRDLKEFQFPIPNINDFGKSYINGKIVKIPTKKFEERSYITSTNGNLLIIESENCKIESVLIKDVLLMEKYAYIAIGYRTKDQKEGSFLIPLYINSYFAFTENVEVFNIVFNFYEINMNSTKLHYSYEVISPYYWKYRSKNYKSNMDKEIHGRLIRRYKEREIGTHKARLGKPSPEAKRLAQKYHIKLKDGETLVRKHIRHYGKNK